MATQRGTKKAAGGARRKKQASISDDTKSQTSLDSFLKGYSSPGTSARISPNRTSPRTSPREPNTNYSFYSNKLSSRPHGDYIDNIHLQWYWDYANLEEHHGYIQWLFPVFENGGLNHEAQALDKNEARKMRGDFFVAIRVLRSYKMMLNFYGLQLKDVVTGEIVRHPNADFWEERFDNLNWRTHNNLRISRIITSLGELGFGRYKKPLVTFFSREIKTKGMLPNAKNSCNKFWKMLLEEDTEEYREKTLETPKDREESIFFSQHAAGKLWEQYLVEEAEYQDKLEALREEHEKKREKARRKRRAILIDFEDEISMLSDEPTQVFDDELEIFRSMEDDIGEKDFTNKKSAPSKTKAKSSVQSSAPSKRKSKATSKSKQKSVKKRKSFEEEEDDDILDF